MQWSWVTRPGGMTYSQKGASWGDGVCQIYGKVHGRTNWLCLSHMIIAVVVEQMFWEKRHTERRPSVGPKAAST